MSKQEKLLWVFFSGILIFLYLLSSTDLIIKEKKTEIYPVSVVIGDTTDDYYVNFRKGVDQAAEDYNVDVSFITLYEKEDAAEQMKLVKREMDDGAEAVVLVPVKPVECAKLLDAMVVNSPLIVMGAMFPNDQVAAGISIDYYEAGKDLGTAIVSEHTPDTPVYLFSEGLEFGYAQSVHDGLMSVLTDSGFSVKVYQSSSGDPFRSIIEGMVYPGAKGAVIAALDTASLNETADIINGSPVYGKYIQSLYGMGGTAKLLNQLDNGTIRGMVVSNQFEEGYLSIERAVEAVKRFGEREQITLESYYIGRENLRESRFEKLLYPID